MIDLSIIVVNWNTKEDLLHCLESIFERGTGIQREVIVVDNASTDGSRTSVEERFPEVNFIQNQMNLGFAKANNQALKLSKGKYVLLLNPDTKIKKGSIGEMVLFMNAHPEVGVVGGQLLNSDGSKQNSIANFPSLATELFNKSLLRWLFPKRFPGKERNYPEPVEVNSVIGACMMVRREALDQVGSLDEDYFLFLEETDWCYRMKRTGWKIYHVPDAEVYHFQGKSAERDKKRSRVEYFRSRYHFFKKNRGSGLCFILAVGLMVRLFVESISMTFACLFTVGMVKRWRRKLSIYAYLLWWHLKLCPKDMGLRK